MKKKIKNQPATTIQSAIKVPAPLFFIPFLKQRAQLRELAAFGIVSVIVHLIMSLLYPTPFGNADTHHYVDCAFSKLTNPYRPFGYSWTLILFGQFSKGTHTVFLMQFFLHIVSALFFIFTIKYLFGPSGKRDRILFRILSVCVIFSPSLLYLSNYVISDSVFISLTTLWVTSGIWIMTLKSGKHNIWMIILHFGLLLWIIQVRYSGLFYPFFSAGIIFFTFKKGIKMALAIVPFLIMGYVFVNVSKEIKVSSKVSIFSPFAGWQSANNALHIVPYIDLKPGYIKDPELRRIHEFVLETPDSVYLKKGITVEYMWDETLPLRKYFISTIEETERGYRHNWAVVSVLFKEYAHLLQVKFPFEYLCHFLLPNIWIAFYPNYPEVLIENNIVQADNDWFEQNKEDYRSPVYDPFHDHYAPATPILTCALWLILIGALLFTWIQRHKMAYSHAQKAVLFLLLAFLMVYMAFHIYAAPVTIRYTLGIHSIQLALIYIVFVSFRREKELTPPVDANSLH